jgi:rhodanese-related sulfurtransferase
MGNSNTINIEEAKKMINDNTFDIILDVRTIGEWNNGHYPSATHFPIEHIDKKFNKLYPNKNIKVLVYCKSGARASKAVQILISQGYNNVYSVKDAGYAELL